MLTLKEGWVAEWLPHQTDIKECSRCGFLFEIRDTSLFFYRYCPYCGSWMKGGSNATGIQA